MKHLLCCVALIVPVPFVPAAAQVYNASCSATAQSLAFGIYNPSSGSPTDATGSLTVTCTGHPWFFGTYTVSASTGSGSYTQRRLTYGGYSLPYQLYTDSGHTQVWGDGTSGTSTIQNSFPFISLGQSSQTNSFYGRIPARQTPAPGSYIDTITVTVSY